MPSFALAAIGRDRPGIVASVAKALFERGCNVEDSSMTLLRGNFAIQLVFAAPDGSTASALTDALRGPCEEMGLVFSVLEIDDRAEVPEPTHMLTVYGADKPGILYRTTALLAGAGVNITDLNSRLVGDAEPVYALMLELEVPAGADAAKLDGDLRAVAAEVGVDMTLRERETDVL
jgi:glycine cleavage system transcriptional repressor